MRILLSLVLIAFAGSARADEPRCAPLMQDVRLAQAASIDQIQVRLRGPGTGQAAARVVVTAGRAERVLRVLDVGAIGLKFGPGLKAAAFRVAIEPSARGAACVESISLYSAGEEIAVIKP